MKKANKLIVFICGCSLLFSGCNKGNNSNRADSIKLKQYQIEGKRLYIEHCSNCHQPDGTGLARLYPPLKKSDYLSGNLNKVICGIKYGQKGEMVVNGIVFNQPMPENPNLTNLEIAEIATYVYTKWSNEKRMISYQEIDSLLRHCD